MFTISKEFTFDASHQLSGLREGHKCMRLHGHTYRVALEVTGPTLNDVGMLVDYDDFSPLGAWINENFDHRHLNDVVMVQPTAERLAQVLAGVVMDTGLLPAGVDFRVGVSETPKTWAWYTP